MCPPNLIKTLTGAHIAHLLGSYSIPNSINLKKLVLTVAHSQVLLESSVVAIQTGKGFLHMFQPEHYTQQPRREGVLQVFLGPRRAAVPFAAAQSWSRARHKTALRPPTWSHTSRLIKAPRCPQRQCEDTF